MKTKKKILLLLMLVIGFPALALGQAITFSSPPDRTDPTPTLLQRQAVSLWNMEHAGGGASNITQFGGTNISTGTGAGGLGIPRVTVSNDSNVIVTPPTLTKGAQGATGVSVQNLKDAGRVNIMWTLDFAPAATAETLATVTESRDGATATTFTTKVVTSGKRIRITSVHMDVENTVGTSLQRGILRMRFNTAGAVTTSSAIQGEWEAVASGTVKSADHVNQEYPDGIEFLGDGTKQIGFTLAAPDWVSTTATLQVRATIFGFEY